VKAKVYVTLKPGVLDPQGKTVEQSLARLGLNKITGVRVGKYIEVTLKDGLSKVEAETHLKAACEKLLSNTVIENYRFELKGSA